MAKKKQKKIRFTISTANDANDDWLQKTNPDIYTEELRIHDELAKKHKAKVKKGENS